MSAFIHGRPGHYLLLLAAGLVLFMNNLGAPSLWDLDEGRNATASLEMLENTNFIVPTFNAQLRIDKPVLMYWLQVASIKVFGINEFAVRFPSALAASATLLTCYELGRALFCPSTALLGGLILGSTALMMGAGRFANPDALLSFFVACGLFLFWIGHRRRGSLWFIGVGLLLGLAVLTKGPVGIVLPSLVVMLFLLWDKKLPILRDRRIWHGVAALMVIALPWYIWVTVETRGTFLGGFLWTHNVSRFLSPMDAHTGSPFYYLVILVVGMAPWSIVIFFGTWYGWWSSVRAPCPHHHYASWWRAASECAATGTDSSVSTYRFLCAWLACYLVFFSLAATKLPNYLLPAALPFALLTARFLDRWRLGEIQPPRWIMVTCLANLAGVGIATGAGLALVSGRFAFNPLAGPPLTGLEYWAVFGLVPVAAAAVGLWCLRRRRPDGVVSCIMIGTLLFLGPLVAGVLPTWNRIKAPRPLVEHVGTLTRDRDIRIGGFQLEHLPSLNFYAQREVLHYEKGPETLAFLRYQVPVYLFLSAKSWDALKTMAPTNCRVVAHHPDLYHFNDIVVVTNFP